MGDHLISLEGNLYPDSDGPAEANVLHTVLSEIKALAEDIVVGLDSRFDSQALQMCRLFVVFELPRHVCAGASWPQLEPCEARDGQPC